MKNYLSDIYEYENNDFQIQKHINSKELNSIPLGYDIGYISNLFGEVLKCLTDYLKFKEHEETERHRITAMLEVSIKKIEADKEYALECLRLMEKDRERFFCNFEKVLDASLKNNDERMTMLCINCLANVFDRSMMDEERLLQNYSSAVY